MHQLRWLKHSEVPGVGENSDQHLGWLTARCVFIAVLAYEWEAIEISHFSTKPFVALTTAFSLPTVDAAQERSLSLSCSEAVLELSETLVEDGLEPKNLF